MTFLFIAFLGLVVAFATVFLGLGGGIILVPMLPTLLELSVREAVATSICTILGMTVVNTILFQRQGLVSWRIVKLLGPISAVTAYAAAELSRFVDTRYILYFLLAILLLVALRGLLASFMKMNYQVAEVMSTKQKVIATFGGAIAGATSGFGGIGSGAIVSPLMIFLQIIEPKKLSPTANANMIFATSAATLSFALRGELVAWNQLGHIRLDIAAGIFFSAAVFAYFLRPQQSKMPFHVKAIVLNLLLLFLIGKISYSLFA